jgi:o-succinylbenzoate---CoA ligase
MNGCLLVAAAAEAGGLPAIVSGAELLTFAAWNERAAAVAAALHARGVVKGEPVAVLLPPDWRLAASIFGILRLGAVVCPLSPRLPPAAVMAQLAAISCRRLVAESGWGAGASRQGLVRYPPEELLAGRPAAAPPPSFDPAAPAIILFTSGSSGAPRPAVLTYGNMEHNARGANANLPLTPADRWLLNLPLFHVSGMGILFRCLLARAAVVFAEPGEGTAAALRRLRPTFLSLVPTQLHDLLHAPEPFDLGGVKVLLLGGAPAAPALLAQAAERRWPVFLTYGMTETASQIATTPWGDSARPPGPDSGRVLPGREVRIAADGEILVRGPALFCGYITPDGLRLPLDREGWFHTGDLGTLDREGYLTVCGRKDALIISGGENIQPEEVEAALLALAGVRRAVVVGVPHPRFGQRPVAFLLVGDRRWEWREEWWRQELAAALAPFKIPAAFYPWPEGASETMKVSRRDFAREAEARWLLDRSRQAEQGLP